MLLPRLLKRLGVGLLGAGSSFLIAACYGVSSYNSPMELVRGHVLTEDGTGIPEMQVCAQLTSTQYCEPTDGLGAFSFVEPDWAVNEADQDGFTLQVRDVDGVANGEWLSKDVPVAPGNAGTDLDITVLPSPIL